MKNYTLGFIFSKNLKTVLLIKKERPDWQRGLLNGIGGKIEEEESPLQAMVRECKEETNLIINDWVEYCRLYSHSFPKDKTFNMYVFYAVTDLIYDYVQMEDEIISLLSIDNGPVCFKNNKRMHNIDWLIQMAINHYNNLDKTLYFDIEEKY